MAEEMLGKAPDAQVDASINVDFSQAAESAEAFAKAVKAVDDKVGKLKKKLDGLPTGLTQTVQKQIDAITSKNNAGLDIDTASVVAGLKSALEGQINKMVKKVKPIKNFKTDDIDKLVKDAQTEMHEGLSQAMQKTVAKMKTLYGFADAMSRQIDAFLSDISEFSASMKVDKLTKAGKSAKKVSTDLSKAQEGITEFTKLVDSMVNDTLKQITQVNDALSSMRNRTNSRGGDVVEQLIPLSTEMIKEIDDYYRHVSQLLNVTNVAFHNISEYAKGVTRRLKTISEETYAPERSTTEITKVRQKISKLLQDTLATVEVNLGEIGTITIDGGALRDKIQREYQEIIQGISASVDSISGAGASAPNVAAYSAAIQEEINSLINRIVESVVGDLRLLYADSQSPLLNTSVSGLIDKINENLLTKFNSVVLPDVVISPDTMTEIRNMADRITREVGEKVRSGMTAAMAGMDYDETSAEQIKAVIDEALDKFRSNLSIAIVTGLKSIDFQVIYTKLKDAVNERLQNTQIKLAPTGAIEINTTVMGSIMEKVSSEINQRISEMPVRLGAFDYHMSGVGEDKFGELGSSMLAINEMLQQRQQAIDGYINQKMEERREYIESQRLGIEGILTDNKIRPQSDGGDKEEYPLIPKKFRTSNPNASTADFVAGIIADQYNMEFTENDLYRYFADAYGGNGLAKKMQQRNRQSLLPEAMEDDLVKEMNQGISQVEKEMMGQLRGVMDGVDFDRFERLSPENKVQVMNKLLADIAQKAEELPASMIESFNNMSQQIDSSKSKPQYIDLTKFERSVDKAMSGIVKRIANNVLASLKQEMSQTSGQDAPHMKFIKDGIDGAMADLARRLAAGIRKGIQTNVITDTIAQYLQARIEATMTSIMGKKVSTIPQLSKLAKTALDLIVESIETQVINGLQGMKVKPIKIDGELIKALQQDIANAINNSIIGIQLPALQPVAVAENEILNISKAIDSMIHTYIEQMGRAMALSPVMMVNTGKLSKAMQKSLEMAYNGVLPNEVSSQEVMSHLMLEQSKAVESMYTRRLKEMVGAYKDQFQTDLDKIVIDPNKDLQVYFMDAMKDMQDKIYRRIRQIIEAQMKAFNKAIDDTIVEPIRTLPSVNRQLNVYDKLVAPVGATTRTMEREAERVTKNTVHKSASHFDRTMESMGYHLLAGSLYAVPFLLATKAKEAIADLSEYEAKMRQNVLSSPESGNYNRAMADSLYSNRLQPYLDLKALQYGQPLSEVYNAGTIVTRRNRPMNDQMAYLDSLLRLTAIDEISPEEGASVLEAVMAQFKMEADQLPQVVREIAAAVTMSQATAQDIGETLKRSSVVGHTVGLNTGEMITLAAVMSQATGQKGDVIGTFLKTALDRMTKQSVEQPLQGALDKAFEKGVIGEKVQIYDDKGNLTSPLKVLSAVAQISAKGRDDETFDIIRRLFGEWQKGRGLALLGELAPQGDFNTEEEYLAATKGYLTDLNGMLERVNSLTKEQENSLIYENTQKFSFYMNRLQNSFQIMTRSMSGGALDNFKTFANALANIMYNASKNPTGLMNVLEMLIQLATGYTVSKLGGKMLFGAEGQGGALRYLNNSFRNGAFGKVDFVAAQVNQAVTGLSNSLTAGVPSARKVDFNNLLFGDTFDLKNAAPEEIVNRALSRQQEYMDVFGTLQGKLQKRYPKASADDITNMMGKMAGNRILSGKPMQDMDITWLTRLATAKPDILETLNAVKDGTTKIGTAMDSANKGTFSFVGSFKSMKMLNVPTLLKDTVTGIGNVVASLGQAGIKMLSMLAIAQVMEIAAQRMAKANLTPGQHAESTATDFDKALQSSRSYRESVMSRFAQATGINVNDISALPVSYLNAIINGDRYGMITQELKGQSGAVKNAYAVADQAFGNLGFMGKTGLRASLLGSNMFKGWNDAWKGFTWDDFDQEKLKGVFGDDFSNSWQIPELFDSLMADPSRLPGWDGALRSQVENEVKSSMAIAGEDITDAEVKKRVESRLGQQQSLNTIAQAIRNTIVTPLKMSAAEQMMTENAELEKVLRPTQERLAEALGLKGGDAVALGLDQDSGNPTTTLLDRLRRTMSAVEDETTIKQLQMRYRGFSDDTSAYRQALIGQKNSELGTIRSQIDELSKYTPVKEEEVVQVQERIAELNKKMWETLVEIKELQENQFGTFNLPDGIQPMTNYGYFDRLNTDRSVAVSAGDLYVTFKFDAGMDASDKDLIKQNVINPAVEALEKYRREREMASSLARQVARRTTNHF